MATTATVGACCLSRTARVHGGPGASDVVDGVGAGVETAGADEDPHQDGVGQPTFQLNNQAA